MYSPLAVTCLGRDHMANEKVPWSMYDHDYNFFGGGGDEPVSDVVANGTRGGRDDKGAEGVDLVVAAGGNSKHRDPFHVRL